MTLSDSNAWGFDEKSLWEILVPYQDQNGVPFDISHHRIWDRKVEKISGGSSISALLKGSWVSPDGTIIKERMIPVRILATKNDIHKIIDFTLEHYNQIVVLCWKLSDECILKYRKL